MRKSRRFWSCWMECYVSLRSSLPCHRQGQRSRNCASLWGWLSGEGTRSSELVQNNRGRYTRVNFAFQQKNEEIVSFDGFYLFRISKNPRKKYKNPLQNPFILQKWGFRKKISWAPKRGKWASALLCIYTRNIVYNGHMKKNRIARIATVTLSLLE